MTVWLASRPTRQPSDTPGWLQRFLGNAGPPAPDAMTELATRITLVESTQAQQAQRVNELTAENAALNERLTATADRFAQERQTTAKQAEIIIRLQSTIDHLQNASATQSAEFLVFSDTVGALKQQNADQNTRMVIMRETIDNLQHKIAQMSEQIKELPSLRHRVQELLLSNEVWRRYAEMLRHQLGSDAPALPEIPRIASEVGE